MFICWGGEPCFYSSSERTKSMFIFCCFSVLVVKVFVRFWFKRVYAGVQWQHVPVRFPVGRMCRISGCAELGRWRNSAAPFITCPIKSLSSSFLCCSQRVVWRTMQDSVSLSILFHQTHLSLWSFYSFIIAVCTDCVSAPLCFTLDQWFGFLD